jgi:hypothetical protein
MGGYFPPGTVVLFIAAFAGNVSGGPDGFIFKSFLK